MDYVCSVFEKAVFPPSKFTRIFIPHSNQQQLSVVHPFSHIAVLFVWLVDASQPMHMPIDNQHTFDQIFSFIFMQLLQMGCRVLRTHLSECHIHILITNNEINHHLKQQKKNWAMQVGDQMHLIPEKKKKTKTIHSVYTAKR